jgi:hypothetical protein
MNGVLDPAPWYQHPPPTGPLPPTQSMHRGPPAAAAAAGDCEALPLPVGSTPGGSLQVPPANQAMVQRRNVSEGRGVPTGGGGGGGGRGGGGGGSNGGGCGGECGVGAEAGRGVHFGHHDISMAPSPQAGAGPILKPGFPPQRQFQKPGPKLADKSLAARFGFPRF